MEVTTSRKPAPPLRTFSKDLAFSLGGHYSPRGKAGLGEIAGIDDDLLIVSKSGRYFLIEVFHNEEPVFDLLFTSYSVENREGELIRGLVTGNQIVYDKLSSYIKVCKTEDNRDVLIFDGAQRRRYVLRLKLQE